MRQKRSRVPVLFDNRRIKDHCWRLLNMASRRICSDNHSSSLVEICIFTMLCHCTAPHKTLSEWSEVKPSGTGIRRPAAVPYSSIAIPTQCKPVTRSCNTAPLDSAECPKEVLDSITPSIRPDHNLSLQHCFPPFRSFLSFLGISFLHSLHLLPRLLHFCLCLPNRPLQ